MEWIIGIAGGIMSGGFVFGGILGNFAIIVITAAIGMIIAGAGSWYQQKQAEKKAHRWSQYSPYHY